MASTPESAISRPELRALGRSEGRITRDVRSGTLVRVLPGTYVEPATGFSSDRRLLGAALAHFGPHAVGVLGTAARLHGIASPWPSDDLVHIRLRPGREQVQRPGLRIHTWKLAADEVDTIDTLPVTTPARTVADLMRTSDRLSAVAAADSALHLGLVTQRELDQARQRTRRQRGAARCRTWWDELDGRAESPLESRVRLRACDGGFGPDELQCEFVIAGRRIRTDFAWRLDHDRWLVAEADGRSVHETPEALLHDRRRANALVATGRIDVLRFTWADSVSVDRVPRTLAPLLRVRRP